MHLRKAVVASSLVLFSTLSPAQAGGFWSMIFGRAAVRGAGAVVAGSGASTTGTEVKPKKVYDADTLTVAQLAECLKSAQALDRDGEAIAARRTAYEARKADLDYEKAKLAAEQAKLDARKTKATVAAYNAKVQSFNALVDEVEAGRVAFNALIDARSERQKTHNAACAKSYYKDDLAAAKAQAGIVMAEGTPQLGTAR